MNVHPIYVPIIDLFTVLNCHENINGFIVQDL